MSNGEIRALSCESTNVGRLFKRTKVEYCWRLEINHQTHELKLFVSKRSGKIKLKSDGVTVFKSSGPMDEFREFQLDFGGAEVRLRRNDADPFRFSLFVGDQIFESLAKGSLDDESSPVSVEEGSFAANHESHHKKCSNLKLVIPVGNRTPPNGLTPSSQKINQASLYPAREASRSPLNPPPKSPSKYPLYPPSKSPSTNPSFNPPSKSPSSTPTFHHPLESFYTPTFTYPSKSPSNTPTLNLPSTPADPFRKPALPDRLLRASEGNRAPTPPLLVRKSSEAFERPSNPRPSPASPAPEPRKQVTVVSFREESEDFSKRPQQLNPPGLGPQLLNSQPPSAQAPNGQPSTPENSEFQTNASSFPVPLAITSVISNSPHCIPGHVAFTGNTEYPGDDEQSVGVPRSKTLTLELEDSLPPEKPRIFCKREGQESEIVAAVLANEPGYEEPKVEPAPSTGLTDPMLFDSLGPISPFLQGPLNPATAQPLNAPPSVDPYLFDSLGPLPEKGRLSEPQPMPQAPELRLPRLSEPQPPRPAIPLFSLREGIPSPLQSPAQPRYKIFGSRSISPINTPEDTTSATRTPRDSNPNEPRNPPISPSATREIFNQSSRTLTPGRVRRTPTDLVVIREENQPPQLRPSTSQYSIQSGQSLQSGSSVSFLQGTELFFRQSIELDEDATIYNDLYK